MVAKPLPKPSIHSAPFWNGLAAGVLKLQRCTRCGEAQHPPGPVCRTCWSDALEWVVASGEGVIYSYTIVHRTTTPGFAGETPYIVALVALAEGPRVTTNIVDCPIEDVRIDQAVTAKFDAAGSVTLLRFAPTVEKSV